MKGSQSPEKHLKHLANKARRDLAVLRRGETPLDEPSRTRIYPSLKPPRRYTMRGLGKRRKTPAMKKAPHG